MGTTRCSVATAVLACVAGVVAACAAPLPVATGSDAAPASADGSGAADTSVAQDGSTAAADSDSGAGLATDSAPKLDTAKADTAAPAPCKPWVQPDSCASGTHCSYDDLGAVACVDNGPHGAGEDCSDGKGCSIGMCITDSDSGAQRCAAHCATDVHCDTNQCGAVTGKKYKVCALPKMDVPPCNPFLQDCADKTKACVVKLDFPTGGCISKGGTAEKGDACEQSGDCKPKLYCTGAAAGGSGVCRTLCKTSGASGCDPVTVQCVPITKNAPYGYCDG